MKYSTFYHSLILHCNPALCLAERAPALFSHSAESSIYAQPRFYFKMADMMKIQQDKMSLILIVDVFGSLNIQVEVFSSESTCVIVFFSRCIITLSAKKPLMHCEAYCFSHSQTVFKTFKLDIGKKL